MRVSKLILLPLIFLFMTLLSENNIVYLSKGNANYQKEFSYIENTLNTENIQVISMEDMSMTIGGCSGGTCSNNSHSCPSGCTHYDADKCSGIIGSCVNDCWSILCSCPGYYTMDNGC
ncbi:hypothetical protein LLG96_09820 [bacterium]|nr:hypothetical protein [bacterium]